MEWCMASISLSNLPFFPMIYIELQLFSMQDLDIIAYIKVDATERQRGFYGIFLIFTRKLRSNHVLSLLFFCYNEFSFLYIEFVMLVYWGVVINGRIAEK